MKDDDGRVLVRVRVEFADGQVNLSREPFRYHGKRPALQNLLVPDAVAVDFGRDVSQEELGIPNFFNAAFASFRFPTAGRTPQMRADSRFIRMFLCVGL